MAVPAAPTKDVGSPDISWGVQGQGLQAEWWETAVDLIWPQSVITYGRMRHDPQITAVNGAYCLPILKATWAIDPEGCRDEVVQHVSDDLGIGILGDDKRPGPARRRGVIWQRHLRESLHFLTYGHMCFERRYEPQPDGYMRLINLGQRPPWTIAHIWVGPDGLVDHVVQTSGDKQMDANRLVWYVTGQEGASWVGISPLRAAFGAWLLKHESWRTHATSIRRFGMGVPQVEAPAGATAAQVGQATQLAAAIRAGDQAGVGLPQGFKFSLAGMSGSAPDALGFIKYLDQSIAKAALAGLIELGQTDHGSRALGETFMDMFLLSVQSVADEIATTATSGQPNMPGIVTDLVDQNWGEDEPAPRIVCTDVGENYEVTAESLEFLTRYGALSPDESLDDWIRKTWRLPARVGNWQPTTRGLPAPGQPGGAFLPAGGTPTPPAPGAQIPSQAGPDAPEVSPESLKPTWTPPPPPPGTIPPATAATPPAPAPGGTPPGGDSTTSPGGTRARRGHVRAAGPRRALTSVEAASGHDPELVQQDWATALDRLLSSYREVVRAQRYALVDQVIAAVKDGRADKLAGLTADPAPGVTLLTTAMNSLALTASSRMIAEADSQGVVIDPAKVKVKATRLTRVAQARAGLAASYLAQQAGQKALQTVRASAADDELEQQAMDAGDMIDSFLGGLSDTPLRDQLGAALTAAQNAGRIGVLEAAPESAGTATYTATEVNDDNTCQPCSDIDSFEFPSLDEAEAAYPSGGYIECLGGARCRGTVIAVWGDVTSGDLGDGEDLPGTGDTIASLMTEDARYADLPESLLNEINGSYGTGDLKVAVDSSKSFYTSDKMVIRGSISDPLGDAGQGTIGDFEREVSRNPDGSLWVENVRLEIDKNFQGQGFASAFNSKMEALYRQAGIKEIRLDANITVGGYAWARTGYDFADTKAAEVIGDRFRSVILVAKTLPEGTPVPADATSIGRAAVQLANDPAGLAQAEDLVARMASEPFGSAGYPTPFEFSNVGWHAGDASWPGKDVMLGSGWRAVKPL